MRSNDSLASVPANPSLLLITISRILALSTSSIMDCPICVGGRFNCTHIFFFLKLTWISLRFKKDHLLYKPIHCILIVKIMVQFSNVLIYFGWQTTDDRTHIRWFHINWIYMADSWNKLYIAVDQELSLMVLVVKRMFVDFCFEAMKKWN